jgi:hypothetical protein
VCIVFTMETHHTCPQRMLTRAPNAPNVMLPGFDRAHANFAWNASGLIAHRLLVSR